MAQTQNSKLAVLIDADNAQASIVKELLAEVSAYGVATVKRAYGDWTTPNLRGWKETLHKMAIQPIQQFSYTTGKNSTDSTLIIDAMDLLHSGTVDGFCLVSSDSDFTRLATRIREAGLLAYGFGEQKTPEPFVVACDKFVFTEILRPQPAAATAEHAKLPDVLPLTAVLGSPQKLEKLFRRAILAVARDDGFAPLGPVGSLMLKFDTSFDPRNYGSQKLGELARRQAYLEVKEVASEKSAAHHLHVRLR